MDGTLSQGALCAQRDDGTIDFSQIGDPLPYARTALRNLKKLGAVIHIVSGRCDPRAWGFESAAEQIELIREWLRSHDIPFDSVGATKPGWACAIVDDRAIRFEGDWIATELEILKQRELFECACQNNGHHIHIEVNQMVKKKPAAKPQKK